MSTLSVILLAGVMTSCGKSTKGKLSNDWKVESLELKAINTEPNGNQTITTTSYSGTTVTVRKEEIQNGNSTTTTQTGTITNPIFKIEKNGTWSLSRTLVFTQNPSQGLTTAVTSTETDSGTWSFIGKNKEEDFKKNERVLFNTMATTRSTTTVNTIGNTSTTSTDTESSTYKLGDNVTIYTVLESKPKELELELKSESGGSTTSGTSTSSFTTESTIKLVQ